MALSVDYIYQFSLRLIRKNQSGSINGTEFAFYWNDQQNAYMADLLGRFQNRNNGKEGANTGLILNETILTKLTPFTKLATLTITAGKATKPTNHIFTLDLMIGDYLVWNINHNQKAAVKQSVIDSPSISENSFYYVEYEDYFSFFPTTVTTADLDYIVAPTNVVWGYTLDGNGRQVYNAGTSVQPQWDNITCMEITKRMLVDLGVTLKDNDFANFGNNAIITGE
jgi:hypothetical protein